MVTVITATRDRPDSLRGCLAALAAQHEAAHELEVIVVDDGGRAHAEAVVATFSDRLRVRCHRRAGGGPAAARNAGAELAHGDRLVFLDDDCRVMPDWLARLEVRCRRDPEALIGGATVNSLAEDRYAASRQLLLEYLYARFNERPEAAGFCASNVLAVPAARFRELGGFDVSFTFAAGEDRDLCDRWRRAGWPLVFAADVRVRHTHPMTLRGFWRQHFRYGRGARLFHRLRGERRAETGPEEPGFYLGLLLFPLRRAPLPQSLVLFGLALVSQLATACGYAAELLGPARTRRVGAEGDVAPAPDRLPLARRDEPEAAEVQVEGHGRGAAGAQRVAE
jgi:GT2 family glycosyltransferase